jgi:hypothetical protein
MRVAITLGLVVCAYFLLYAILFTIEVPVLSPGGRVIYKSSYRGSVTLSNEGGLTVRKYGHESWLNPIFLPAESLVFVFVSSAPAPPTATPKP